MNWRVRSCEAALLGIRELLLANGPAEKPSDRTARENGHRTTESDHSAHATPDMLNCKVEWPPDRPNPNNPEQLTFCFAAVAATSSFEETEKHVDEKESLEIHESDTSFGEADGSVEI